MPAYGNNSATPSASNSGSDRHKQAFVNQAIAWEGLSETPGDPNGFSGSYRQIIDIINPNYHSAWCAMFVSACAKQAGIQNIIPANSWAYGIGAGIIANGGKSIPGKASTWACDVTPAVGDTIQFGSGGVDNNGNPTQNDSDHVYHVGMVIAVDHANRKFTSMEGNCNDKVCRNTYSFSHSSIYYLARPNWSAVGGFSEPVVSQPHADGSVTESIPGVGNAANMLASSNYDGITVYSDVRNGTPNDRHDMTMREIGYWSDNARFVTDETDITISAINYTTLLGNLYDMFAEYYPNGYTTDTSNLSGTVKILVDYFMSKSMSPAAACGITAGIYVLSHIDTGNHGGGICNWQGIYRKDMHQKVEDWSTNLSGQLDYLWTDLSLNYDAMLQILNNFPVSDNGARLCANRFTVSYVYMDTPQDVDTELNQSTQAQNVAAGWFNQLRISATTPYGTSYSTPTAVTIPIFGTNTEGNVVLDDTANLNTVEPVVLQDPSAGVVYDLTQCAYPQTGINTAFTSYSSWYNDWNRQSPQYKLAHIWGNDWARSCDRGIATINGCYLVAVAPTYGSVGTMLQITLDNGATFKAIIADIKSPSDANYCPWGHLDGNGRVNIIEWEVVKVLADGTAATSGGRTAGYPPDLTGWAGANVRTIKNLGKLYDLRWG